VSIDNFGFPVHADTPWWKFWLARLFGRRMEAHADAHVYCVAYKWRGEVYVWSIEE
jgi:hypothetical protein